MFWPLIYPVSVYATPEGAFCSTGKDTTVYLFPLTDWDFAVTFGAAAAAFRNAGGESVTSSRAAQAPVAGTVEVFEFS